MLDDEAIMKNKTDEDETCELLEQETTTTVQTISIAQGQNVETTSIVTLTPDTVVRPGTICVRMYQVDDGNSRWLAKRFEKS